MQRPTSHARSLRFEAFQLDLRSGELSRNGRRIRLPGQPFQLLITLLEHPGELVTREELKQKLWPEETFVDFDHSLNTAIKKLRQALDDDAETPKYIETLPRRGYRFIAAVERTEPPAALPLWRRRSTWAVAALALLALLAGYLGWQRRADSTTPQRVMLAVLPFENLSGDPSQEYFSDGLTEEMITQLGRMHPDGLGVIARTSAMHYKGTSKRTDQIGRELRVDYILEGSLRRSDNRIRVTAQLIRVSDQTHLWAESYDRSPGDILTLQQELAAAIADEIQVKLTPQQQARLRRPRPVDPEAHEAYLRARYHLLKFTRDGGEKAIEYFQEATAKDPTYALAYAGLADAHVDLSNAYVPPHEAMPKARAAALKALELDPTLAEAHTSLGVIHLYYDWDWPAAEREFKLALELNPNLAEAHRAYLNFLVTQGRFEEALLEVKQAYALDPLSSFARVQTIHSLFMTRQYDETIEKCRKMIDLEPDYADAHMVMGLAFARQGRFREALAAGERARALSNTTEKPFVLAQLSTIYAEAGEKDQARKLLDEVLQLPQQRYVCAFNIALVYVALDEADKALELLQRGFLQRSN